MENKMFCYQCQEAAKGAGCILKGVCGKNATTARSMDLLLFVVRGISVVADQLRQHALPVEKEVDKFIVDALFCTITNANFDDESIMKRIDKGLAIRDNLKRRASSQNIPLPEADELNWKGCRDEYDVEAGDEVRDFVLRDRRKKVNISKSAPLCVLREARFFHAVSDEDEGDVFSVLHRLGDIEEMIEIVREGVAAEIADDETSFLMQLPEELAMRLRHFRAALPFLEDDAVPEIMKFLTGQAVLHHVFLGAAEERHEGVAALVSVVLSNLKEDDKRVVLRHAADLIERRRPEVVNLVNVARARLPRDFLRRIGVERVG